MAQVSIDAALVCHNRSRPEQNVLISTIRSKRRLTPILCIKSYLFETAPKTCITVENDLEAVLNALQEAIYPRDNSIT